MPRHSLARATAVERICIDCQRTGLDVRVDHDGKPRCFAGIGCNAKRYRATGTERRTC